MRHFHRSSLAAVAAILAAVSVRAAAPSTDIPANVDAVAKAEITASALRAPVRFLASDELEGRGPATRGDALARLYLSAQLETLGYLPGGDNGGWEQAVEVVGVTAKLPATWNFTGKGGDFALKWSDDYIAGSGFLITPVLSVVNPGFRLRLNPDEVDDAFEVPLRFLMNPANHVTDSRIWNDKERFFYRMPYQDWMIWGITAGIIHGMYERLYA